MRKYKSYESYRRLLVFVKPYVPRLLLSLLCMILASATNVVVPWLIKDVIDKVLTDKDLFTLNLIVLGILVLFFFRGLFFYGQTYLMNYIGQKVIIDIREALYRHLQRLSLSFYDRRKTGTVMSNMTNDVGALQTAIVDNLVSLVSESVVLIGSLVSMFMLHWKLTLLTLTIVPIVLITTDFFGKRLRSAGHEVQGRIADITALLQETISGIRIIRSFNREGYEINRFVEQNNQNFRAVMRTSKLLSLLTPVVEFLAAIAITAIIWYGGMSVINGVITAGALIAFLIYAINLANPVKRISNVYGNIQKSLAASDRVFEILDTEPEIKEKKEAISLPPIQGHVSFEKVGFSYDGKNIALQDFTLNVQSGKMIALVGPSGAGKSTIINLLPRFYDTTEGRILIDGIDIRDVTFSSLRNQIALVPQETMLFNASIRDNILYGRLDATDEEIIEAAKAANAHEFIMNLPAQYDTLVGERGSSLSGGQRQRIAIARAILKNPRILLLDEATSALDTESEKVVQSALDRLMKGRTTFAVAHRLSTIQNADTIVVINKGKIEEMGTHQELLEQEGLYAYLYSVQFSEKSEG